MYHVKISGQKWPLLISGRRKGMLDFGARHTRTGNGKPDRPWFLDLNFFETKSFKLKTFHRLAIRRALVRIKIISLTFNGTSSRLLSSGVPNDPDRPPIPDLNLFGPNPFTDSPTIRNSAQLHGDYDVFYQYLGQQSNWEYGIAQQSPLEKVYPYTAFKAKTFFKPNQKYNFKIEQNRYYFDDNQGRF